jgi:hypothetical protein
VAAAGLLGDARGDHAHTHALKVQLSPSLFAAPRVQLFAGVAGKQPSRGLCEVV